MAKTASQPKSKKESKPLNKPMPSTRAGKKMMVYVKNPATGNIKTVHFGADGYKNNYSAAAKKNYLSRSAGIKDKSGRPTKNNPLSPNYWARKVLWGKRTPVGTGAGRTS